jgi:hypothetical protein
MATFPSSSAVLMPNFSSLGAGSVTPPISSFFGLDPQFLAGPAASPALLNNLLYGSSYQMVPINFGSYYSGIPPIFGGQGFTGFPTTPYSMFSSQPSMLQSPFTGGAAFGNGYGTSPFGVNQPVASPYGGYGFSSQPYNPFGSISSGYTSSPYSAYGYGSQMTNPFAGALNTSYMGSSPFGFSANY